MPFRHIDADQQHEVPATAAPLPDGFTRMTKDDHSFLVVHMRDHTSFKQRLLKRQNDRNIVGKDGESLYFLKADYTGDGFTGMTLHRGRDDACPLVARYVGGTRHHGMTIQLAMPGNFGHTLPVKSTSSHPFKISLTFVTQLPSGAAAQWTVSGTDGSCKAGPSCCSVVMHTAMLTVVRSESNSAS